MKNPPEELPQEYIDQLVRYARTVGMNEDDIRRLIDQIQSISKGKIYENAHIEDVSIIAHESLNNQNAKSITLKISKKSVNYRENLKIEILDVED